MSEHPSDPQIEDGVCVAAKDWLGNTFRTGERVLYCIGAGRGQLMATGEVLKIEATLRERWTSRFAEPDETPTRVFTGGNGTEYRLVENFEPHYVIRVQVRTLKTSGDWGNEERTKPAWVNPLNITSLNGLEESARG